MICQLFEIILKFIYIISCISAVLTGGTSSTGHIPNNSNVDDGDVFKILGITDRKSYLEWIRKNHPDRNSHTDPRLVAAVNQLAETRGYK